MFGCCCYCCNHNHYFQAGKKFSCEISAYLPLKVNSNSTPKIKCMGGLNPDSLQTDIYITNLQACPKETIRRRRLSVSVPVSSGQRLGCTTRAVWGTGDGLCQYLWVAIQRLSLTRTGLTELSVVNFLKIRVLGNEVLLKIAINPSVIKLYHFSFQWKSVFAAVNHPEAQGAKPAPEGTRGLALSEIPSPNGSAPGHTTGQQSVHPCRTGLGKAGQDLKQSRA